MIGTEAQDAFISRSVIAIVTTLRADGSPMNSMVGFARRRDLLYFTTTTDRAKGRTLSRDPRAALTILNPAEAWSFVSVEGEVVIHRDNPQELRDLILDYLGANPDYGRFAEDRTWSRTEVATMIAAPGRAVFEVQPKRVSGTVFAR